MLPRGEAEPAGEVTPALEGLDVPDGGEERGGGEDADPRDLQQCPKQGLGSDDLLELVLHGGNLLLEATNLIAELLDEPPHLRGNFTCPGLQESRQVADEALGTAGADDAELLEQASHGVDALSAGAHPLGPDPVQ